jgi:nitrate reductase gamma subunit
MNVKENKLTKASLILILIGFVIMILSFILALTQRGDPFGYGMALLGGLIFAGSLYVIAIIILVINRFKKRIIIK